MRVPTELAFLLRETMLKVLNYASIHFIMYFSHYKIR